MNSAASSDVAWQAAVSSHLPEIKTIVPTWDTIDLSANVGRGIEHAAREGDKAMLRRLVDVVLELDKLSSSDERLIYAVQDILRGPIASPSQRAELTSVLNARTFGQLAGYIDYVASKEVVKEMSSAIGLRKRGA